MEIDAEEPRYIYIAKVLFSEHSVITIGWTEQLPKWASPLQNLNYVNLKML